MSNVKQPTDPGAALSPSPRHNRKLMAVAIVMGIVGLAMCMFIPLLMFGLALFSLGLILGIVAYVTGKVSDVSHDVADHGKPAHQ